MNDEPPKTVKAQLVRLDDSLKQIERRQVAGIQRAPGSLPVLEAFEIFLEKERQKSRRRLLSVTALAVMALALATVGGVGLVRFQMQRMTLDYEQISSRTDALAGAMAAAKTENADELISLEDRFREESRQVVAQYAAMLEDQRALQGKIADSEDDRLRLRQELERLRTDNERLSVRMETMARPGEPAANRAAVEPAGTGQAAAAVAGSPAPAADRTEPPANTGTVQVATLGDTLQLTILPEGHHHGIRWRLPRRIIPE